MTEWILTWFKEIFDYGVFSNVSEVLKLNPSTGAYANAWNAVNAVYSNVMVPIALGLMVIWFLVALAEKATADHITLDQIIMVFVKLIAAKYLIDHGLEIFTQLWGLGISLIDQVGNAFPSGSGESFNLHQLWHSITKVDCGNVNVPLDQCGEKLKLLVSLGVFCQLLIPWLVSKVMIACVYFICYSRLIEMLVRMLAAPIALSDFMTEGIRGAGWRYLKGFLAICLQGMIVVAIAQLYPLIMSGVLTGSGSFWTVLLKYVAFSFAAVALMFKSLTLSKELVGAS